MMQGRVIMAAIEISQAAGCQQVATMERMVDSLRIAQRKGQGDDVHWREQWASDFLACLPAEPEAVRLILLSYLPVYVCGCGVLHLHQGRCDGCNEFAERYQWQPGEKQRLGGISKSFWQRVQDRRLFATGLKVAESV